MRCPSCGTPLKKEDVVMVSEWLASGSGQTRLSSCAMCRYCGFVLEGDSSSSFGERVEEKKDMGGESLSKKYLAGVVDFGILGRREAYLFKNERKEKENQPAFRLVIKEGDSWKEVGVFWIRESKPKEDIGF